MKIRHINQLTREARSEILCGAFKGRIGKYEKYCVSLDDEYNPSSLDFEKVILIRDNNGLNYRGI